MIGRVPQHAVIAPISRPREIRERHQFDRGHSGDDEMIELADHGAIGAFRRKGADMAFEDDRLVPGPPAPVGALPPELTRGR